MSVKRKKTILRTIRLPRELDDILQIDAQENDLSVNALLNKIITKYIEWDRHVHKFGFVSIASETFRAILEEVDKDKIENVARNLGNNMPQAVTMFWFKRATLETLLTVLSLFGKYSNLHTNEMKMDEKGYTITFHHNLGAKWSIFLRHFISQFIKSVVGIEPEAEITGSLVTISFPSKINRKTKKENTYS